MKVKFGRLFNVQTAAQTYLPIVLFPNLNVNFIEIFDSSCFEIECYSVRSKRFDSIYSFPNSLASIYYEE